MNKLHNQQHHQSEQVFLIKVDKLFNQSQLQLQLMMMKLKEIMTEEAIKN
jgi:DnaJ-domain-containing protein 1